MHNNGGGKEGETHKRGKNQSIGNTHKYEMTIITLDKDTNGNELKIMITTYMLANILMKPPPREAYERFVTLIGLKSMEETKKK